MTTPEFKSADKITVTPWELQHTRVFADVLRLFDTGLSQAKADAPEGWGYTVEASIQGFALKVTLSPPPRASSGGGWQGKGGTPQGPPKFDRVGVEAVLTANQDTLNFKEEGSKIIISPKKFLGDLWGSINEDMKKYGMSWVKDSKNSRWEGSP